MVAMREKHRDEVDELERKLSKKERERKELEDDCRDLKHELESSKGEVRDLKVCLSERSGSNRTDLVPRVTDRTISPSNVTAHGASGASGSKSN